MCCWIPETACWECFKAQAISCFHRSSRVVKQQWTCMIIHKNAIKPMDDSLLVCWLYMVMLYTLNSSFEVTVKWQKTDSIFINSSTGSFFPIMYAFNKEALCPINPHKEVNAFNEWQVHSSYHHKERPMGPGRTNVFILD